MSIQIFNIYLIRHFVCDILIKFYMNGIQITINCILIVNNNDDIIHFFSFIPQIHMDVSVQKQNTPNRLHMNCFIYLY